MPAKNLYRKDEEGAYYHVYNKGVENRLVFNDEEDYKVFQSFLKDYLTVPQDPENIKKVFTVRGHVFRGTPHQSKNYYNKIDLLAYSLMPNHFHLLLHQITKGSLERLIRSLCTRYSIYFNKKYQRTGGLFEGPYKSVPINDELRLLHLTRYLHQTNSYSSYAEYLGTRETSWVKPNIVLSSFSKGISDNTSKAFTCSAYKDFVEKYKLDQKEKELIANITFDSETQHLESTTLAKNVKNYPSEIPNKSSDSVEIPTESSDPVTPIKASVEIPIEQNLEPLRRKPEFLATAIVFLLLLALGIRNIMISTIKNPILSAPSVLSETIETEDSTENLNLSPITSVLPETVEIEEMSTPSADVIDVMSTAPTYTVEPKILLTIKIYDKSTTVNIRQKPTINSKKIGKAKSGDIFEFVSMDSEWYEVKLATGSTGFISAEFIEIGETNN